MTKIDVYSGFLGAGKTTLIKKLIKEAYAGEKVVLIENEFGEIGVDGGFLQDAGVNVTEMNSGCICCSLVGDFAKALQEVAEKYAPDRIIIEPSGVGKLSDVVRAVERADVKNGVLNALCAVVDAKKCKMYLKNFGEFFVDQVENATCVVLSHTDGISEEKLHACLESLKELNADANYVTADWSMLEGKTILSAMENKNGLQDELKRLEEEYHEEHEHCCHHHDEEGEHEHCCHHHDEEGEHEHCCHHHDGEDEHEHCCHHHDGEDEHEHCCHHHEEEGEHEHCCHHHEEEGEHEHCCHHHDEEGEHEHCCHHHEEEGEHEHCCHHHEEEGEHEHCCHHHDGEHHHGHHHADEVFTSWGIETAHKFTPEEMQSVLSELVDEKKYGIVLRAKGIVDGGEKWLHFDYVPGEADVRYGTAGVTGRLCVIGCNLNEDALKELFKA